VDDLTRNGEQLHLHLEAVGGAEEDREEVEEERAVIVGLDGEQSPPDFRLGPFVYQLQIRRFSRKAGAVVDDLDRQLPLGVVQLQGERIVRRNSGNHHIHDGKRDSGVRKWHTRTGGPEIPGGALR